MLDRISVHGPRQHTVLVVEHDAETILRADYVIDLGPGAGRLRIKAPQTRRAGDGRKLVIHGARAHDSVTGLDLVDKVIEIDQSPIGRTPRSNPATYTGVFSPIRDLYSILPESRERGYKPGRFSFNVKEGRCEACQGDGLKRIEWNFLPDVYVTCHLGQSSTTLSGGEAQRIKLARELSRRQTGRTLYILDEPTTGLHFDDVKKLLAVLQRLVDLGNTVVVIEHQLDVVKSADWIIDLGPEGGERGGHIVAVGTPEQVARHKKSYTGQALAKVLP
jgi:excinuclease ABC subunit A